MRSIAIRGGSLKSTIPLISVLAITAGGLGYVIYDKSKKHEALEARLLATENTATQEAERFRSELATLASTSQNQKSQLEHELETAKRDGQNELAAARQKADDEIKQLQAELADVRAQNQTSKQQSDALATLMEKVNAADALINVQLARLFSTTETSEKTLFGNPSAQAFASVKKNYESIIRAIDAGSLALGECEAFVISNAGGLAPFAQQVQAVTTRVARGKSSLTSAKTRVEKSLRAARESHFAALANTSSWQGSDLNIEVGEQLAIDAKGTWRWALSLANPVVGPSGTSGDYTYRQINDFNNGALLLRIRGSERVGLGFGHIIPDRAGRVEFLINDTKAGDNSGTMEVTMWVVLPITQP